MAEVWCGGRGFRQELRGIRPCPAPREFAAPAGSGTRWEFVLDADWFGQDAALAAEPAGPGYVLVRDLRDGGRETQPPKI